MNIEKNPMYNKWVFIRKKCNPNSKMYKNSTICKDWENSKVFIKWAESNFKPNSELISINNHYSPETCKFVTKKEKNEIFGITKIMSKKTKDKFTKEIRPSGWKHNKESLEKRKKTNLEKYGVENVFQNKSIQEKQKQTCLDKYYCENVFQNKEIKEKIKKTNLKNIGVEYPTQSNNVKDKIIQTNIKKFNKPYYSQTQEYKDKVCKTNLDKYGVKYLAKSPEIMSKILKSNQKTSKPELEIKKYLNSFGLNFEKNYDIIPGKEIDLYDKDLNLAIEYCGVFWHSEKRSGNKYSHVYKLEKCKEKNIRLITIFDDEWLNKKTQVKNLLRSVINKNIKIFARKCEFKQIDNKIAKDFINQYHIQGCNKLPQYSFGLFYENELVSVMSFNNHHRGLDQLILSRFCSIYTKTIIGGGTKLLKNALKYLPKKNIYSWSDNRYSNGDFYKNNNFIKELNLRPDYSYINESIPSKRFSKQSMQKKKIKCPENITECDFLKNLGYYRIWDCGKIKWKYINN